MCKESFHLSWEELHQQPQALPSPGNITRVVVPRPPACRSLTRRRLTPQSSVSSIKPVHVPEITSDSMAEDIEIVESLSQLPCCVLLTSIPTKRGDATFTPDSCRCGPQPVMDVSEDLEYLKIIQQGLVQEADDYVARMNAVGIFVNPSELMD